MDCSTPGLHVAHHLRVHPSSCPLNWWWHPTISSSASLSYSCLQSFPASGSFPVSQLFSSGDQSIGALASASVLPMSIQGWFPSVLTGLISLLSKGLSWHKALGTYKRRLEDLTVSAGKKVLGWVALMCTWHYPNIVNRLCSNKKCKCFLTRKKVLKELWGCVTGMQEQEITRLWSWISNTWVAWCKEELTDKDPNAGKDWRQEKGETGSDAWTASMDGWMTQWTWVEANSRR